VSRIRDQSPNGLARQEALAQFGSLLGADGTTSTTSTATTITTSTASTSGTLTGDYSTNGAPASLPAL